MAREVEDRGGAWPAGVASQADFRADSAHFVRQRNRVVNLKAGFNMLLIRDPDVEFNIDMEIPVPLQLVQMR